MKNVKTLSLKIKMGDNDDLSIPSDKLQVEKFLFLIRNDPWITIKSNWMFVGQCIYNTYGYDGYDLFKRYTSHEFLSELDGVWHSYYPTRHGTYALKQLARKIDPNGLKEWLITCSITAAYNACEPTSGMTEIADICKFMFGDQFICASVQHNQWYQFINSHWQGLDGGHTLKQKFSRELVKQFEIVKTNIAQIIDPSDKEDPNKKTLVKCINIIKGLKEPSFKQNLMRECSEIFFVDKFEDECDEDPQLLGLPNGVYDFRTKSFRTCYPEDWITLQTGANYRPDFSWNHPDVENVMKFFKKVLYDDELINFMLLHKSTCLVGGNLDKYFPTYIGETAHNGKTTYEKLDELTFGKYCTKLPLGVLVGKTPDSTTADPAMAGTKGVRLAYVDEANERQKFNFSFLKRSTGNDTFWARKLYSNGVKIKPQFTLIMIVNRPPKADSSDAGIWERIVMIPFDSRFTTAAPESEEEQWKHRIFPANPFIDDELRKLKDAYLWVLIQYYFKYLQEGLKKPDVVLAKTDKYKTANDIYLQFNKAKVEKTNRLNEYVSLNDLYIHFKNYFNETHPKEMICNREDFCQEELRLLGEMIDGKWYGYKMKVEASAWNRNQ